MDSLSALSKYRIIEKLGAGGMGEVYKAEDPALLRIVAIKVVSKSGERTLDAGVRFLREARAASAFNHPNIVTVYEIGHEGATEYIAMERIQGRTLAQMRHSLELREALRLAAQIAD